VTILVLEAGELWATSLPITSTERLLTGNRDSSSAIVTVPGLIGHGFPPAYNWNLTTTPQEFLDNKARDYGQGHVVGGGSILNGIVTTRGARADYDAWQALGNPGWAWQDMLPYFKKVRRRSIYTIQRHAQANAPQSETFSADISPERARMLNINPDQSVHGTSGPLEVTYPTFLYNQSSMSPVSSFRHIALTTPANFLRGLSELGVPLLADPNAGVAAGAMVAPASMSAANQSRMDSRRAYLDPVLHRPNLHLAVQQTVTRILIETNGTADINVPPFGRLVRAYGVEVSSAHTYRRRS
jgi:choline dehydrogenase-like flavoprotein